MATGTVMEQSCYHSQLEAAADIVLRFKDKEISRREALNQLDRLAVLRDEELKGASDAIADSIDRMFIMVERA